MLVVGMVVVLLSALSGNMPWVLAGTVVIFVAATAVMHATRRQQAQGVATPKDDNHTGEEQS